MSCDAFFNGYMSKCEIIFCANNPLTGKHLNALRYSMSVLSIFLPEYF